MAFKDYLNFLGASADFGLRNFSVYGQWLGIVSIFVCIGLGVANIFHVSLVVIFLGVCIAQGLVVMFVEVPFLLKICPMLERFISFVGRFNLNWWRVGFYVCMAAVQWALLAVMVTSLIVPACFLTCTAICYALALVFRQEFAQSEVVKNGGVVMDHRDEIVTAAGHANTIATHTNTFRTAL